MFKAKMFAKMTLAVALLGTAFTVAPAINNTVTVSAKAKKKHYKLPRSIRKQLVYPSSGSMVTEGISVSRHDYLKKRPYIIKSLEKVYNPHISNGKHGKEYYYQGIPLSTGWLTGTDMFIKTATQKDLNHLAVLGQQSGTHWLKKPLVLYALAGDIPGYELNGKTKAENIWAFMGGPGVALGIKRINNKPFAILTDLDANNKIKMYLCKLSAFTNPLNLFQLKPNSKPVDTYVLSGDDDNALVKNTVSMRHEEGYYDPDDAAKVYKIGPKGSIAVNLTNSQTINGEKYYTISNYDSKFLDNDDNDVDDYDADSYDSVMIKASDFDKLEPGTRKYSLYLGVEPHDEECYLIPNKSDLTKPAIFKPRFKWLMLGN